jgi:pyruvate dehydrogenase E1 component alpha subunit
MAIKTKDLPDTDLLLWMYRRMVQIRQFEDKVYYLFLQGRMSGTIHQYQGQEAVATSVCATLRPDDYITSTHRPHGHAIAKGVSIKSMMAELFGREAGCCRARGGSMHMGDIAVGMPPAIAIVAAGIPVAAGMALAFKFQRTDQVAACFFGDGAVNEGAFHEGVNLAAVWKLPVVFVCENNFYAASTPVQLTTPVGIADRAAAYGIPGVAVDGNDVLAVYRASQDAVARARSGAGPTLLECQTYRRGGHSRSDPGSYRPKEEVEEWLKKDPIERLKKLLLEKGIADEAAIAAIEGEVQQEIEDAVAFAQESPSPKPEEALPYVYGSEV